MRNKFSWGFLALWLIAGGACAGPPFVTDDPDPVDLHKWEVNYAATLARTDDQTSGSLPVFDVNYGLAEGVQFHVQPQMAYSVMPQGRNYGLGDTEVGVKYRLTPETGHKEEWMVSVYPIYRIATGNAGRGLGAGASSLYLPVWFQTTRHGWTVFTGGGYSINGGSSNKNTWATGLVALYQFTERLQFGGELFAKTAATNDSRGSSGFNIGGNYWLTKDYSVLFSAGRGLGNAAPINQASAYIGLQARY